MANKKTTRKAKPVAVKKSSKPKESLSRTALVARATDISQAADINIVFTAGLGQITSSLFRLGVLINLQSISNSGTIHFSDVQSGDAVSLNGICTGTASISITVPTDPVTPQDFTKGPVHIGFDIL